MTRDKQLARPRLFKALEQVTQARLTLLAAPAGYGKTTLLTNWLAVSDKNTAWLSLDEADNEPKHFFFYLLSALRTLDPALSLAALDALEGSELSAVLTLLVNDLAAYDDDILLILDDYHVIDNEQVHWGLEFLLEHAPPQFHVLISSRSDPPLPFSRFRARAQLSELRTPELRFSPEEVGQFLSQVMQLDLLEADVCELEKRTEGWIAGLQLAALSLRNRSNASAFIEVFTGTDRHVLDYLTEEVLQKQSAEMQDFLVLSSVLTELCGPLCAAVTGDENSQEKLMQLERDNLFITPLDNRRQWYRLHPFFADLLRQRLNQARPDLLPNLHALASEWFEAHELLAAALRHALLTANLSRVEKLIQKNPRDPGSEQELKSYLHTSGEAQELRDLLRRLNHPLATWSTGKTPLRLPYEQPLGLEPLSERELEVLRLIAAGFSNKAIARRLDISLNTVKTHSKNINSKLAVSNRTQASARAKELGLL